MRPPLRRFCSTRQQRIALTGAICLALLFVGQTAEARRRRITPPDPVSSSAVSPAPSPGELPLAAMGAVVIDALTGETLYQKNCAQAFYPASTTKILTALIVIEEGNLDQEVTVTLPDTQVEPSSLDLKPGEMYTRRQLLFGMMLKSANDVARALARDNAGSIEAFAAKMNTRARELGATSSHFANPNGLHNKEHYTTPRDLALIARAAMQQPFFRRIVSTVSFPWISPAGVVELRNHNRLLWEYPGCTGLKTGYTIPAQQVLVSSALKDGREVISVVMHTNRPGIWEDSKLLLTYGLSRLASTPTGF